MPNLNHRFLFMVGRVCLTIGAVVALSGTNANAAMGYACLSKETITVPTGCSFANAHTNEISEGVFTLKCGSGPKMFTGVSRCSIDDYETPFYGTTADVVAGKGGHCWCKITGVAGYGPVSSHWVHIDDVGAENCIASCAQQCHSDLATNHKSATTNVFNTIGR